MLQPRILLASLILCSAVATPAVAADNPVKPQAKPAATANDKKTTAKKIEAGGYSYYVDKLPAWVDSPAPNPSTEKRSDAWYYNMIDRQYLIDETGEQLHINIIRKINDANGLVDAAKFETGFDPAYQKLIFHEITVIRDGQPIDKLKTKSISLLRREQGLEVARYDGSVTASVNLEDARIGDQIHYRYTIVGANPVLGGRVSTGDSVKSVSAADLYRFRLVMPQTRQITIAAGSLVERFENALAGGKKEIILRARSVPAWDIRTDGTPADIVDNIVQVSGFSNWTDVAQWGTGLFPYQLGGLPTVNEEARRIAANAQTPEQQVTAVLDFVQQNIRYFSILFGQSSHRPTAPDKVLAQRFGDCKDKSFLMVAMLRELGLTAYPVLVSTNFRDSISLLTPGSGAFDHAIVGVDIGGKTYWLDPTRSAQMGTLDERQAWTFGRGLPLKDGIDALAKAPDRPANLVDAVYRETYIVEKFSEPVRLRIEAQYFGEMAERIRVLLSSPQRQLVEEGIFEYVGRRFTDAKPLAAMSVSDPGGTAAITVSKEWALADPFEFPQQRTFTLVISPWTITPELKFGQDSRKDRSISLGPLKSLKHSIRVEFPEPITRQTVEKPVVFEDKHFRLRLNYLQTPKVMQIDYEFNTFTNTIEVADLKAAQAKAREATDGSAATVKIPALSLEQIDDMQKAVREETENIRSGRTKVVTGFQAQAAISLIVADALLNGKRMNATQTSSVLAVRASAYKMLGQLDKAAADVTQALALNAKNAEAYDAGAEIEFSRGRFQGTLDTLAKASAAGLKSAGEETLFQKGRAHYFLGDLPTAMQEFGDSFKQSSGTRKIFSLIWLQAGYWRQGQDAPASLDPLASQIADSKPDWPYPILQHIRGAISQADLLAKADAKDDGTKRLQLCEAYFFLGLKKEKEGDKSGAMRMFEKSIDTGAKEYIEYYASGFELARLRKER